MLPTRIFKLFVIIIYYKGVKKGYTVTRKMLLMSNTLGQQDHNQRIVCLFTVLHLTSLYIYRITIIF